MEALCGTFTVVRYDEGGVRGQSDNLRLVCVVSGGDKLALWGSARNSKNIDLVRQHGLPCKVRCQYRNPSPMHYEKFGHTHWVPEDYTVEIVS